MPMIMFSAYKLHEPELRKARHKNFLKVQHTLCLQLCLLPLPLGKAEPHAARHPARCPTAVLA